MAKPPTAIKTAKKTIDGIVRDPPMSATTRRTRESAAGTNLPIILFHSASCLVTTARALPRPQLRHQHRPPLRQLHPATFQRPPVFPPCRSYIFAAVAPHAGLPC